MSQAGPPGESGVPGRQTGTVVWFSETKGYGFLRDTTGKEVFVHFSNVASEGFKTLKDGEDVEFTVEVGPQGKPQAVNVMKLG